MRNKEEIRREIEIIKTEAKLKIKLLEAQLLELELAELRGETKDEIKVSKSKVNTSKVNKAKVNKTTKTSVTPSKAKANGKFVKGMQEVLEEDEDEDFDIDEFLDNYQEKLDIKSLFSTEDEDEEPTKQNLDKVLEEPKEPKIVVDKADIKMSVNRMVKEFSLKDKKKFKAIANEMLSLCNDGIKLNEIEEAIKEHVNVVSEDNLIEELKLIKKLGIKQYVDKTKSVDEFDIPEEVEVVEDVTDDILSQLLGIADAEDDLFKDFK